MNESNQDRHAEARHRIHVRGLEREIVAIQVRSGGGIDDDSNRGLPAEGLQHVREVPAPAIGNHQNGRSREWSECAAD